MRDYTSENPTFSEKICIVEESDLVNAENDAAASKQLLQNDLVLSARLDKCLGSAGNRLELDEGIQSDTLIGAVNEVFQLGSESKQKLVENLTAMGVAASTDDTWGTLLDKILDMTDTSKDTVTAAALLSGYTAHDAAGVKITGTLADKSVTTDHSASASLDVTNKRLKLKVPMTAKYGTGNYLYAAYSAVASLIGLTSAKLVKNNTILGIAGSSGNMDTSGATAAAADILSGKKACVKGSLLTGSMANKGAWTGATTGNGNVAIPAGYHNGNGYISGAGAYNKGVSDADARVNTGSANYQSGYSAGVRDADGRVNTGSTNYQTGYNAGVSATKVGTAGAGDVLVGKTFTNSSSVGAGGTMPNKGGTTVDAGAVIQDDNYTYFAVPANGYYNTNSKLRAQNSNLVPDSFFGLPFVLKRNNAGAGENKPSTNVARLYISEKYKNTALRASGHITSNTGPTLKVTITANKNGEDTEIYTSSGSGKQDKDYSATIPDGTEYIEITVYHGSTGQQISYEVQLNSLIVS
ncbi:MAG: hypothetical protein K2N73_08510 [Lachnospiraceae bacterium]|nr:hypothetical protein [Lachnospiraceae bacterium]